MSFHNPPIAASSAHPHLAPSAITPSEPADEAGRFANPADLLTAHSLALLAMIGANVSAMRTADRAGQTHLAMLNKRGCGLIAEIEKELSAPDGISAGLWGEHGKAPLIRALVRESERVRRMVAEGRLA